MVGVWFATRLILIKSLDRYSTRGENRLALDHVPAHEYAKQYKLGQSLLLALVVTAGWTEVVGGKPLFDVMDVAAVPTALAPREGPAYRLVAAWRGWRWETGRHAHVSSPVHTKVNTGRRIYGSAHTWALASTWACHMTHMPCTPSSSPVGGHIQTWHTRLNVIPCAPAYRVEFTNGLHRCCLDNVRCDHKHPHAVEDIWGAEEGTSATRAIV